MTFAELSKLISDNNIPEDVVLMSDSGWECGATDMDGVYYNDFLNMIIFSQDTHLSYIVDRYCLHPEEYLWRPLTEDEHDKTYYERYFRIELESLEKGISGSDKYPDEYKIIKKLIDEI